MDQQSSHEYWVHLLPKQTLVSTDEDTIEAAALRSRLFFHISQDDLDYNDNLFHPAFIQEPEGRQKWAMSALQQLRDLVGA